MRRVRIDWRAVGVGASLAVLVTVPPAVLARALRGDDLEGQESNLWVVPVLALFIGFGLGGHLAARRRPDAPLLHSAAAALAAFVALCGFVVLRRLATGEGLSAPLVVTLALLLQITVSLAVLGGYVAMRREARGRRRA
ncbi:MAG TPA: hypothetical protein VHE80_10930 [Acidimicrobiales bacterium]|nr:hypothetical protein [Acidimicrobiales bacterium]